MVSLEPPRPGSALGEDAHLRGALTERIRRLEAAAAGGGQKQERALRYCRDIWTVLAVYPWWTFSYRHGYWTTAERNDWPYLLKNLASFTVYEAHRWVRGDLLFQLLDPRTGGHVAEIRARPEGVLTEPGGRLRFAGDPRTVGVYWPDGGGIDAVSLARHVRRREKTLTAAVEALRQGAAQLPPPLGPVPRSTVVWLADSPGQPTGKAPKSYLSTFLDAPVD
jgi:hypothetical protein